jgi:hypothetical protein
MSPFPSGLTTVAVGRVYVVISIVDEAGASSRPPPIRPGPSTRASTTPTASPWS